MKTRIMTVDLEPDLRSASCQSIKCIPKLLDFFDDEKIRATFFTVTSLLEKYEFEIKEIAQKHEIASHSHTHNRLNPVNAAGEIKKSKELLEEHGIKCKGFRSPGFITTENHFKLLKENNYYYDASLGVYFPGRYRNLSLPKKPFMKEGMLEFPMSTFVYPIINSGLSYLKLCHPLSKMFPQPYMFYLHPWEFLKRKEFPPAQSFGENLLQRNSGKKAWNLFKNYVEKSNGRWLGCQDWIEKNKKWKIKYNKLNP